MNAHPGGSAHTRRMLELAFLPPDARILDLGAGAGETVELLRSLGYDAEGIDLVPRSDTVQQGDLLHTGLPAESCNAVISQCAFWVSGDVPGALRESYRLLRPGGTLLLSDVEYEPLRPMAEAAGFHVLYEEDMTSLWKEYYIEAIWRGDPLCCELPRKKCGYRLLIGRKDGNDGSV